MAAPLPWVVLHVPHDSTLIPDETRDQFPLDRADLQAELIRMTDHRTLELLGGVGGVVIRATVSRLVVDVERFEIDDEEPMAARGMGVVYQVTSHLEPLRRPLSPGERQGLIDSYYRPHHTALEMAVSKAIDEHGHCLIIDCHSFPSRPLPYEFVPAASPRPDICIGTDDFHTSPELAQAFVAAFAADGFAVALDTPFAGAIVPSGCYKKDRRVSSVMVEVNRSLYLDEQDATPKPNFADVASAVQRCCRDAAARVPIKSVYPPVKVGQKSGRLESAPPLN